MTGAVLFFGLAGLLFVVAMQTPWHPKAIESHLYRFGEYVPYRRIQPWGRVRILALAAGCAFVAWRYLHIGL